MRMNASSGKRPKRSDHSGRFAPVLSKVVRLGANVSYDTVSLKNTASYPATEFM
jgi:hypothetical protein